MAKRKPPPRPPGKTTEAQTKAVFRGFLRYVQRPGSSVREVWDTEKIDDGDDDTTPMIKDVMSLTAFQKAATQGQWKQRRDDHWVEVKHKVLTHIQSQAVRSEIAEIEQLEALKQVALRHIVGDKLGGIDAATPKSLEGAIGAFVQLDKRVSSKREVVAEQTAASAGSADKPTIVAGRNGRVALNDNDWKEAEVQAMARALATNRAGVPGVEKPLELPQLSETNKENDND